MAEIGSVDWVTIKTEYITTKATYDQLSKKYGVSVSQISRVSVREKWREARKKHAEKCYRKAAQKAADAESRRLAKLMDATNRAADTALRALEDEKQFNRYIITEGIGGGATETTEREFAKIDTRALKDLTSVIKDLTGLMREFYNLPTPSQAEAQRIAAARLEMDQKKADADSTDGAIEVIIKGEAEEWAK